ncbi:potassium transporter TrkA [Haloferula helveola]|uniref:Potassium transporter TrkA n=2 Tax=Haloferula helveola TaxID=490095 RepID=A0ABN6H057_9BACT|nr:potassium transporter TrkA [Haloferula helveola]
MMVSMIALATIVVVALLIVQLGANALALTGMSQAAARFQAASAFFGVGFTTQEAEMVVNHPVRRRIILHLIIAGNVGITSALATLIVTLMNNDPEGMAGGVLLLWILGALVGVGLLLNVGFVKKPMDSLMRSLLKRLGVVQALDYDVLLRVKQGFSVAEVELIEGHPFIGKALGQSRPGDQGIVILGVYRKDGRFVGAPGRDEVLEEGDLIMVYGSDHDVGRLRSGYRDGTVSA